MACCASCRTALAQDPEGDLLDLSLLEVGEYSAKIGFSMPHRRFLQASSSSQWWWPFGGSRDDPEFTVSVFGGPNSDIYGPKEDRICCRRGRRVVHEVRGLVPDTEYTVEVNFSGNGQFLRGQTASGRIEVRTAAASTAQFAEEDWGRGAMGKDGKEKDEKDGKVEKLGDYDISTPSTGASSSSSSNPGRSSSSSIRGPTVSPQRTAPLRTLSSGDECSTIAPSDAGDAERDFDDAPERAEDHWEQEPSLEEGARNAEASSSSQAPRDLSTDHSEVHSIEIQEVTEPTATGRGIQCNLCSMMDCLKLGRRQATAKPARPADPNEIVLDEQGNATAPAPAPAPAQAAPQQTGQRNRGRRPHRPPFPGQAVDPASVGLELLPALNASQLQAVIDDRARQARRDRGV
eukprot:TRINITY_DN36734_c0_g1_i1.p1 TRINITY_DN36734_c0_g1~~TRINITY_DN36734_c0_g1_i1.p1  ORF type:complete len:404 (-),score=62.89 TRINITY_DN36734_c0_g1_i1:54-1265(-)